MTAGGIHSDPLMFFKQKLLRCSLDGQPLVSRLELEGRYRVLLEEAGQGDLVILRMILHRMWIDGTTCGGARARWPTHDRSLSWQDGLFHGPGARRLPHCACGANRCAASGVTARLGPADAAMPFKAMWPPFGLLTPSWRSCGS